MMNDSLMIRPDPEGGNCYTRTFSTKRGNHSNCLVTVLVLLVVTALTGLIVVSVLLSKLKKADDGKLHDSTNYVEKAYSDITYNAFIEL